MALVIKCDCCGEEKPVFQFYRCPNDDNNGEGLHMRIDFYSLKYGTTSYQETGMNSRRFDWCFSCFWEMVGNFTPKEALPHIKDGMLKIDEKD
jgi:hypothetical protein